MLSEAKDDRGGGARPSLEAHRSLAGVPEIAEMRYNKEGFAKRDWLGLVSIREVVAAQGAGGAMESKTMYNPNQPLPFDPEFLVKRVAAQQEDARRAPRRRTGPRTAIGAPGYLSVRRAAEVLGMQPRSVIYLLAQGLLKSQRLGRSHFLPVAEVERYRRVRRDRAARARLNRTRSRIRLVR